MSSGQGIISTILEGLLGGVNAGLAGQNQRRQEQRQYDQLRQRKLEEDQALFDQNERQRQALLPSQIAEEQQKYERERSRKKAERDQEDARIFGTRGQDGLYANGYASEMANKDPNFILRYKAAKDNVKVTLPTSREVGALTSQGKFEEAWSKAQTPEDQEHVRSAFKFHEALIRADKPMIKDGQEVYRETIGGPSMARPITNFIQKTKSGGGRGASGGKQPDPNKARNNEGNYWKAMKEALLKGKRKDLSGNYDLSQEDLETLNDIDRKIREINAKGKPPVNGGTGKPRGSISFTPDANGKISVTLKGK